MSRTSDPSFVARFKAVLYSNPKPSCSVLLAFNRKPVLQAEIDGDLETVAWAWQRGDGGRSFGFSGGHFHQNWQREEYRRLMAQAVLWTLAIPLPESGLNVEIDAAVIKLD